MKWTLPAARTAAASGWWWDGPIAAVGAQDQQRLVAEQVPRVQREPGLDAALGDQVSDLFEQLRRLRVRVARLLVHEHRQRHAPGALARDAPVGAGGDHGRDALLGPGRHLGPGAAVGNGDFFGSQAQAGAGRIDRHVAPADDDRMLSGDPAIAAGRKVGLT